MAVIKVTQGAVGITYTDRHGQKRHALKDVKSKPFECDDAVAARFVRRGVAKYVDQEGDPGHTEEQKTDPKAPEARTEPGEDPEFFTEEELEKLKNAELKELAENMGIDVSGLSKKADYIDAILADQEEDLPDLEAEDPVG